MKKEKLLIGERLYASTDQAMRELARLRHRYADGQVIVGDDHLLLVDLLLAHPRFTSLVGAGLAHFSVRRTDLFEEAREWVLHRIDDTTASFPVVLALRECTRIAPVVADLQRAILPYLIDFRDKLFAQPHPTCCMTEKPLTLTRYRIAHTPPHTFVNLLAGWLVEEGKMLADLLLPRKAAFFPFHAEAFVVDTARKHSHRASWVAYWQERAVLRGMSVEAFDGLAL